jgi:hypothetical protein
MDKFLIRKPQDSSSSSSSSSKRICVDLNNLPSDPGLREKISSYHPNDQDNIRRAYLQKGPCQIVPHNLPQTEINGSMRRFNPDWFIEHKNWLEYSIEKDVILLYSSFVMITLEKFPVATTGCKLQKVELNQFSSLH